MALSLGIAVKANGASSATTAAQTTTAGSAIQVEVSCSAASGSPPTVTDSKGNTYTLIGSGVQVSSNPGSTFIYKNESGTRGSSHTFSVTASDVTILVIEILGASPVVDTNSTGNTDTTSTYDSDSITPTVADFLLVGTVAAGGTITSWTAGASFTKQLEETNDSLYWTCALATRIVTGGSGSYLTSWTTGTGGTTFGLHVVAWKESGSAATADQEGFRFRNDDGSETTATWAAAQDTDKTAPLSANLRLRALINGTGDLASTAFTLRFQKNGSGGYVAVPIGPGSAEAYSQPTWGAAGTAASGTTSAAPAYPTGISASTSKLFCMVTGRGNTANTVPTMPAGWTRIGGLEGGTGTWAVDTGTRRVDFFIKDTVTGSETGTVTVSLSGTTANTLRATIFRVEVASGYGIDTELVSGADTTNGTGYSATASANATFDSNRLVLIGTAQNIDTGTATSRAISATGITFGTLTNRADTAVTNGNDHRHILNSVPVSSGSGTVAPTFSYTISASGSGPTAFLVLRGRLPAVTNEVYIATSSNVTAGGEATTAQLTAPSGKSTSDFVTGRLWDDENGTDSIDITTDDYTELEWCLQAQSPAANGDYFDFRVYAGASALDTYTVTPRWTIGSGNSMTVGSGTYSLTGQAVNTQAGRRTQVAQGSYAVSGQDVGTLAGKRVLLDFGSYSLSGQAVATKAGRRTIIAQGSYTITGQAVGSSYGAASRILLVVAGSYAISGQVVLTKAGRKEALASGVYTITGSAALVDHAITIASGTYSISGQTVGTKAGRRVTMAQGSYSITGFAVVTITGRRTQIGQGSYAISGQAVTTTYTSGPRVLSAQFGTYSVAGQVVLTRAARRDVLAQGSYSISGQAVATRVGRRAIVGSGSYTITGQAVTTSYGALPRVTVIATGSYTIAGQAIATRAQRKMAAAQGSYSVTGQPVGTRYARRTPVASGSYTISGFPVTTTASGAPSPTFEYRLPRAKATQSPVINPAQLAGAGHYLRRVIQLPR